MRSEAVDRIFAAKKKKKWLTCFFFSFIVPATFGPNLADSFYSIFKQQRAFPLFIYHHLNTKGKWENSRKLCKRQTQLRVCIALESIQKNSCQFMFLFTFCNELIQDLESSASGRTPFSQHGRCNPPVATQPSSPPLPSTLILGGQLG